MVEKRIVGQIFDEPIFLYCSKNDDLGEFKEELRRVMESKFSRKFKLNARMEVGEEEKVIKLSLKKRNLRNSL